MRAILEDRGCLVCEARDGYQAVSMVEAPVDVSGPDLDEARGRQQFGRGYDDAHRHRGRVPLRAAEHGALVRREVECHRLSSQNTTHERGDG